jgi:uncharacterized membrane protein
MNPALDRHDCGCTAATVAFAAVAAVTLVALLVTGGGVGSALGIAAAAGLVAAVAGKLSARAWNRRRRALLASPR